jgi:EAL domain-containing protein (putative c-di-GMP-specific phosphodiesterase class I)
LCPTRLKLQISETTQQVHGHQIIRQLQRKPFEQLQLVIDSFDGPGANYSWLNSGLVQGVKVSPSRQASPRQSLYTQHLKTLMVFKNLLGIDLIGCDIRNAAEMQQLRDLGCDIGMGPALANAIDSHNLVHALPRSGQTHEHFNETQTH